MLVTLTRIYARHLKCSQVLINCLEMVLGWVSGQLVGTWETIPFVEVFSFVARSPLIAA